jgi:hypothetical protein
LQRHQFEAYLDKVFDWRRLTAALTEGRQYPLYPWAEAFDAVFLGSACPFGPLHRMLKDLSEKLGRRFVDILVADALYLQTPFVREVESLALLRLPHRPLRYQLMSAGSPQALRLLQPIPMDCSPRGNSEVLLISALRKIIR